MANKPFEEHLKDNLKKTLDEDLWETMESFLQSFPNAKKEDMLNLANQLIAQQEVRNLGDINITLDDLKKHF